MTDSMLKKGLVWSPRWNHTGESILSAAFKIALASDADVADVAWDWAESLDGARQLRRKLILPTVAEAGAVLADLGLSSLWVKDLFAGVFDGTVSQRERFYLGLRWCPVCAESWQHRSCFQEWRRSRCPVHGVLLLDRCPRCNSYVDFLGKRPWHCSNCERPLTSLPPNWPQTFALDIDWSQERPSGRPEFMHSVGAPKGDGTYEYVLYEGGEQFTKSVDPFFPDFRFVPNLGFEEASILLDCFVGKHGECVRGEFISSLYNCEPIYFTCPVAAAAVVVARMVGAQTEPLSGFPRAGGRHSEVLIRAGNVVRDAPVWLWPILVREYLRGMFCQRLDQFAQVREEGRRAFRWYEPSFYAPEWTLESPTVALIEPVVSMTDILDAVARADVGCPNWHSAAPDTKETPAL